MNDVKKMYVLDMTCRDPIRPATAEEIKAALSDDDVKSLHPKCETCVCCEPLDQSEEFTCESAEAPFRWEIVDPFRDYCRHHTPKEQDHE